MWCAEGRGGYNVLRTNKSRCDCPRTALNTHDASSGSAARLGDARSQMRSHPAIGFRPAGRVPERSHARAITPRDGEHKYSGLPAPVGSAQQPKKLLLKRRESASALANAGRRITMRSHNAPCFVVGAVAATYSSRRAGQRVCGRQQVRVHGGELASSLLCDRARFARRCRRRLTRAVVLLRSQISQLAGLTRVSRSCSSRAQPEVGGCAPAARRSAGATG